MDSRLRLLVKNADQVVTVVSNGEKVLKGSDQKNITILNRDGRNGVSVVVDSAGQICAVGHDMDILSKYSVSSFDKIIDALGMSIIPGLIDAHTHPVWAGDRVHEFALKLAGATYMEVHKAGGGIHFTVEQTKEASEEELYNSFTQRMSRMLACGTTLVECKTGYGLQWDTEHKMLRVIEKGICELPIDISSTYCAAHAVPKGMTAEQATDDIVENQVPALNALLEAGTLHVDNIDVFCEQGVYDVDQSRRILQAGKEIGLNINFHGEELHLLHSAEMGAGIGAAAISHLEEVSSAGMEVMAEQGTVAVILPTTAYILRLKQPPVREMIDIGVPVALGSDFNPNAFCMSMPLVMHLACVNLKMSMTEALAACTINAAASVGKSSTHGSLEVGKVGDMLILNTSRWEHLIYQFGGDGHVIRHVIKQGKVVHTNGSV